MDEKGNMIKIKKGKLKNRKKKKTMYFVWG